MYYQHTEIRNFANDTANGSICEQALIAAKNLESAIRKRKSITSIEREACLMLIQCATEIAQHIESKPIDDTHPMIPRELREGLKREVVANMARKFPSRISYVPGFNIVTDSKTNYIWSFDAETDRLKRMF